MKTRTIAAVAAALIAVVGAACEPAPTEVVQACVSKSNGAVRVVADSQRCWSGEYRTSWARQGAPGRDGTNGRDGRDGTNGADGTDGQPGPAGHGVHSGNGAPDAELGALGEFYVDLDATVMYGPKGADGWGDGTPLVGPQGPAGVDGADGNRISTGTGTPVDAPAGDGDLYLDLSNFELHVAHSGEWVAAGSLQGAPGPKGDPGEPGPPGAVGPAGPGGAELLFAGTRWASAGSAPAGVHTVDLFVVHRNSAHDETVAVTATMNIMGHQATNGWCQLWAPGADYQDGMAPRFNVAAGQNTSLTLQASVFRPSGSGPFHLELRCSTDASTSSGTFPGAMYTAYASPGMKFTP